MTSIEVDLAPLEGKARPLREWLTTFPLAPVVLDPYTHESAWLLDTARRVLANYTGAGVRPCWIVLSTAEDAREFLGPYATEFVTFADPDRAAAAGLGIEATPAFMLIRQDGAVVAKAEGWSPQGWREVAEALDGITGWLRPQLPEPGDPVPFSGVPLR